MYAHAAPPAAPAETLEAITTVARLISSLPQGERVFRAIAEAAVTLLRAKAARVWVDDPAAERLREKDCFGSDTVELRYGEGLVGATFISGNAHFVVDRGDACVPLATGDQVLGALSIMFGEPREFTPAERETMMFLGRQAAEAISAARLIEENERRRQAAESLVALARAISQSLDTREIARRAAQGIRELLGAESAALFRLEPGAGDLVLIAACGEIASVLDGHAVFPGGRGVPALAVHGGRPGMSEDLLVDPRVVLADELRARLEAARVHGVLSVPLLINDTVVGLLGLWDRPGRLYSLEEIALAEAAAAQAALALENARLYEEVRRSYTELRETQQQLAGTQKMEAIGRLAGGVAHDFNNLLTVIVGRAAIAKKRPACDAVTRQDLGLIESTGQRAARLTGQLLAFSRRQALQPKILDLNALVSEIQTMLRRLIGEDLDLITLLEPGLGRIEADPGQIEQVILNLAVNARDAMPHGGQFVIATENVTIEPAARATGEDPPPGAYVVLRVTDTGCGMSAETQAHIFEPFFTTKEPGRGTGLGLSTVYGIVTQSGGHIVVDSELGKGTTFRIYLPRVAEGPAAKQPDAEAAATGTETILVVEDEAEVRGLISSVLQERGYRVLEAGDGRAGVQVAEGHAGPIDLLLTDVVMPLMKGPDLATRFTQRRPGAGVLFMSGYPDDALAQCGVSTTADRLLLKPFSPARLAQQVRLALDSSPAAVPR